MKDIFTADGSSGRSSHPGPTSAYATGVIGVRHTDAPGVTDGSGNGWSG